MKWNDCSVFPVSGSIVKVETLIGHVIIVRVRSVDNNYNGFFAIHGERLRLVGCLKKGCTDAIHRNLQSSPHTKVSRWRYLTKRECILEVL